MTAPTTAQKSAGAAAVSGGCLAILCQFLPVVEGVVLHGYRDPLGIVSACVGHTKTAKLSMRYTPEKCQELLIDDIQEHAAGVQTCVPPDVWGALPVFQQAAVISFTFNVGVGNFCGSTMRRRIVAGDPGFCSELPKWTKGRKDGELIELPGLVKRRAAELAICEKGVA